jgi:hypothetical protein
MAGDASATFANSGVTAGNRLRVEKKRESAQCALTYGRFFDYL